jgi:hypothetical protein
MTALTERKMDVVRTLVEQAPDRVVGSLQQALANTSPESALGSVRRLVEAEVADRNLRNSILQPVVPMFGAAADDHALTFPGRALAAIWRGLKADEPDLVEKLRTAVDDNMAPHHVIDAQDKLIRAAATAIRNRQGGDYCAAAEAADAHAPGGAEVLTRCLEIGPVVRRALTRLPEWITHSGKETAASARIAYRDAVGVSEDSGPLFFQMLASHLAQRWMVMRLISAVMDKPTERYLRDSEVAGFGETLLGEIDESLELIAELKADDGPDAARSAARAVDLAVHQIMEIDTTVELPRDQGWGKRLMKQRSGLAGVVEGRLKEAERWVIEALPLYAPRGQKVRHQVPRLVEPPNEEIVARAVTLLTFSSELNSSANYGGFSATRNKVSEKLGEYVDHYVEAVIDLLRTQDVEDPSIAAAFLNAAARFSDLFRDEKAGELVRRRAHTALNPDPPQALEG